MTNWCELGSPKLTAAARKYLRDRAVEDDVAKLNNLRSLTPEETERAWHIKSEALLIPHDKNYATARLFDIPEEKRKFRTTYGKGQRLYEPALPPARFKQSDWRAIRKDPKIALLSVEGPIKSLAAVSAGLVANGVAGCWNWQKDRQPLQALRAYKWNDRKATPIFDGDITENRNVLLPFLLYGDWLSSQGAPVEFLQIPGGRDGLDDYLKKHGRAGFDKLPRYDWENSRKLAKLRITAQRDTEGGLSELFVLQCSEDVRYDPVEGRWYKWNGTLWMPQPDRAPDIQEEMKKSVAWIIGEGNKVRKPERRKALLKWGIKCDKKIVIRGAIDLASSDPRIRVSRKELDADPWLLGTRSGILDLRTGKLLRSSRAQLVTRSVAAAFDPKAKCPRWEQFISEIMDADADMEDFLQRLAGYLLIGGNPERQIYFLYNEQGSNGKTVFIETLAKLLGDYSTVAKSSLLTKHRIERDSEAASPFLMKLRGVRYITVEEVEKGAQINASVVKSLTGGDRITGRNMYDPAEDFYLQGKVMARANCRLIIEGDDQPVWDRVVEIGFPHRFEENKKDKLLLQKLEAELSGILNWALQGCLQYQKDAGLHLPNKVKKQIEAYRNAMDSVAQWLQERTEINPKARTENRLIRGSYEHWCEAHPMPDGKPTFPVSKTVFNDKLEERGFARKESNSKSLWIGIAIKRVSE